MLHKYFKPTHYAFYIAGSYGVFSVFYILTSGKLAEKIATSQKELMIIEANKGIVFVVLTSLLIFFITRHYLKKTSDVAVSLLKTQEVVQIAERRALAGALASSITHDANNILGSIFLRIENLQAKVKFDQSQAQDVTVILNSVKQLGSLMKRIKTVGGLRKIPIHKTRNKITSCVQEVLQLAAYHERCMDIQFETRFGSENEYAVFDGEQFSQMLLNLLINACEAFSEHDRPAHDKPDHQRPMDQAEKNPVLTATSAPGKTEELIKVHEPGEFNGPGELNESKLNKKLIRSKDNAVLIELIKQEDFQQNEFVVLNVHDNGPGVTKENIERILSPFYSTKREGSGLGLISVLMFANDHGGEVKIGRSEILGGAVFSVSFAVDSTLRKKGEISTIENHAQI